MYSNDIKLVVALISPIHLPLPQGARGKDQPAQNIYPSHKGRGEQTNQPKTFTPPTRGEGKRPTNPKHLSS